MMRTLLFCLSFTLGGMLVVLSAGCSTQAPAVWEARRPPSLVPAKCDMGMLRMTKPMFCSDELNRAPLWGRS